MESFILALGLLLVSSWLNAILYVLEVVLVVYYFHRHPNDRLIHRVIVMASLFFDTAGTIAVCGNAWLYLITYATSPPLKQLWTLPTMIITTNGSSVLEQTFLLYRIWKLSQNRFLVAFLFAVVVTHTIFGLTAGIYVIVHPEFARSFAITATMVANTTCAAADILISFSLVWVLHRVKSPFRATRSFIRRLTINIISTGVSVAVTTIVMLVLFLLRRAAFNLCFSILGRLYTITVLVNLCLRSQSKRGPSSTGPSSISWSHTLDLTSIHVDGSAGLHLQSNSASSARSPAASSQASDNVAAQKETISAIATPLPTLHEKSYIPSDG